ncbi:Rho GTPase activating protein 36 [Cricetulus griseus]
MLDCLFASAFEPRPRRVSVLGGAPGQNPDRRMDMVSIHSLSELERLKLQETAYHELVARHFLSEFKPDRGELYPECGVLALGRVDPPDGMDRFEVLEDACLKTFGIRLEEVLVNEITRRKHLELEASMLDDDAPGPRGNVAQRMFGRMRRFFNRRRIEPTLPREFTRRGRRGAVSVDSLSELEGGDQLLQNLQISQASLPIGQRLLGSKRKMSLNPIARQVPQIVEICCKFIEKHGLNSVGIFTSEYSVYRVLQLRDLFDQGLDIVLPDSVNVHDVAALLRLFFREMKDSLVPEDLYMSFLLTATLSPRDQVSALQLLVYLMPPCHSDTLERLLKALHKITENCEDSIGVDGQLVPGNRMTSTNLALVFGTTILKKGKLAKRESRKTKLGIDHYVASVNVVRAMIDNWDILFQVPPHIQKQVAKRVWKASPEALDFIRRRNQRKMQSARIKMEEDALVSDPVENSTEAQAAVLAQSQLFDEELDDEIPEIIEIPNFEELPCFNVVPAPEGAPDVHDMFTFGDSLNYDFDDESDFEDQDHLDLAEVPYLDVVPNNEDADSDADEIPGNDEAPDINEIPDNVNAPNNDEPQDSEKVFNLEKIPSGDEVSNDEPQDSEKVFNLEKIPSGDEVSNDEPQDSEKVFNLEKIPSGDEVSNDEPQDSEKVFNLEKIPSGDEVSNDEPQDSEKVFNLEKIPSGDEVSNDEPQDSEKVFNLEKIPSGDEVSNDEPQDSEKVFNLEKIPSGDEVSNDEPQDSEKVFNLEKIPSGDEVSNDEPQDSEKVFNLEKIPSGDEVSNDEPQDSEKVFNLEKIPSGDEVSNDEPQDSEKVFNLEKIPSGDEVSNDEPQDSEKVFNLEKIPSGDEVSNDEPQDSEKVFNLEKIPSGDEVSNDEPQDSEKVFNLEKIPSGDEVSNDEPQDSEKVFNLEKIPSGDEVSNDEPQDSEKVFNLEKIPSGDEVSNDEPQDSEKVFNLEKIPSGDEVSNDEPQMKKRCQNLKNIQYYWA